MTTIVYLISSLRKSGPVNVLMDICRYLNRQEYNPVVVTLKQEDRSRSIKKEFEELGVTVISFDFSNFTLMFNLKFVGDQIKKRLGGDSHYIVHAHCYYASLLLKYFPQGKTVQTIHCIAKEDYVMRYGSILGRYMVRKFCKSLKYCSCPIVISQYMEEYYRPYCNQMHLIYNGVDFKRGIQGEKEAEKPRLYDKLKIPSGQKIILYSGYFSRRKNPLYIIQELKKSKRTDFLCLFIGKGELLDQCRREAAADSRFRFEGYVFNVKDYLSVADIYVSASLSEGFPLAVLEALNMGVPVLLSAIKPHQEIQQAINLSSVQLFDLSREGLVSAMDKMLDQEFDQELLSEKSVQLFSAQTMTRKYEFIYQRI